MEENAPKKSITGNLTYHLIFRLIMTLSPLIVAPHLARELGASNLGIFTFVLANVQYFVMCAKLGIEQHGQRSIAECFYDKEKYSQTFWNLYTVQFLMSLLAAALYLCYSTLIVSDNKVITLICIFWIFGAQFNIEWLLFGIEEFKVVTVRNMISKILQVACIMFFVRRGKNPLLTYTIIMSAENFLCAMVLLPVLKKYIVWKRPQYEEIKRHIKPLLILFIPQLALSVFHNMDRTMLGLLTTYDQLGYYSNAFKLVNVPAQITLGMSAVFLPRAVSLYAQDDTKTRNAFLDRTFEFTAFLSAGLTFGMAGCTKDFVPVFFGSEFLPCIVLTYLFAPSLIIKTVSDLYRSECMIPLHQDNLYIWATIGGAVVNLIFNFLLIPRFGANGAAAATVIAEFALMVIQFKGYEKGYNGIKWLKSYMIYIVMAAVMFMAMDQVSGLMTGSGLLVKTAVEILIGGILYLLMCCLYWFKFSKDRDVLNLLTYEFKKRFGTADTSGQE